MLKEGVALTEEVIRAKRFEVVDDEGNVRALTTAASSGAVATNLFDSSGNPRVSLAVYQADIPTFGLFDADGTARIDISSGVDGQTVRLNDENGNPRAMMSLLTDQGSAPTVTFMDKEGNERVTVLVDQGGTAVIGFNDESGELQVALGRDQQGRELAVLSRRTGGPEAILLTR